MTAEIIFHYSSGIDNGPFLVADSGGVISWVRNNEPLFFQKVPGHKREVIEEYRGFIIVSHTRQFSLGQTERVTMAYLFNRRLGNEGTLLADYAQSPAAMRRKIDHWWRGGQFPRKDDDKMTVKLLL